jgi:hypothetical protein
MKLPRTLVIEQEDEETIVDARARDLTNAVVETQLMDPAAFLSTEGFTGEDAAPPRGQTGVNPKRHSSNPSLRSWATGLGRWRPIAGGVVLGALICVLATLALRERHNARKLQALVEDLSRARYDAPSDGPPQSAAPSRRVDPTPPPQAHPAARFVDRDSLERRGAELLGANDYVAALAHYRALSRAFPEEHVFVDAVEVLQVKTRCLASILAPQGGCP